MHRSHDWCHIELPPGKQDVVYPQFFGVTTAQAARLSGEKSMAELCREHQLTSQMVGNWKQQFLAAAPRVFERGDADSDERVLRVEPLPPFSYLHGLSDRIRNADDGGDGMKKQKPA